MDIIQEAKQLRYSSHSYNGNSYMVPVYEVEYMADLISRLVDRLESKEIYAIYEAWSDSMENQPSRAFGYSLAGVVFSKDEAERICNELGIIDKNRYGWAAPEGRPVRYYMLLKPFVLPLPPVGDKKSIEKKEPKKQTLLQYAINQVLHGNLDALTPDEIITLISEWNENNR